MAIGTVAGLEPGTWADWANAVGTILAFTVALALFTIGLRDRRRANNDRRRDQARRVWIWPGGMSGTLVRPGAGEVMQHKVDYQIDNTSAEPISRCRVGLLKATPEALVGIDRAQGILRPGGNARGTLAYGQVQHMDAPPPPLQVTFIDSAGIQWRRDSNGNLEERRG